ncbi:hypothetical protein [Amycolatopsis sp. TNS106]|uniref:hypothetical protein n=1 Tax=Amycolatopsis sp. TNS106 TaxID=2861750 RepID=UPI001C58D06A
MGPPALAMVLAAIGAPLLARRVRPGYLVLSILLLLLALTEVDHQAIAAGYTMSGTRSA